MSKKNRTKLERPTAAQTTAETALPPIIRPEELCSPEWSRKVKLALLVAGVLFLLLRLVFLNKTMAPWDDIGPMHGFVNNPTKLSVIEKMRDWSYAPAQFFLTNALVKLGRTYEGVLFWGRLPSLLMWALGLVGVFAALRRLLGREYLALTAVLTVWAAVSWRGLLESSQSYNYVCALPTTVFLTWLFVSREGFAWLTEPERLWRPALAGLAAGMTLWFTYQALFVVVGGFLLLGVASLWRRNYRALRGVIVAGLGFSVVFGVVYVISLRFVKSQGIGWAGGIPGDSLAERLSFLPQQWLLVLENIFTFLPPRAGSLAVVGITLALMALGGWRLWQAGRHDAIEGRALLFVLALGLIWSAAPYVKAFPLAPSRHTYVLQFPLLLLVGILMKYLHPSRRVCATAAFVITAGFFLTTPILFRSVENRFDAARLRALLGENPNSLLLGYPGGSCLDYNLLTVEHPEWGQRMADGTWQWTGYMQHLASAPPQVSVYAVGVQSPMLPRDVDICRAHGFKVESVEEVAGVGSVEPWRKNDYIKNSFYLYRLAKAP